MEKTPSNGLILPPKSDNEILCEVRDELDSIKADIDEAKKGYVPNPWESNTTLVESAVERILEQFQKLVDMVIEAQK